MDLGLNDGSEEGSLEDIESTKSVVLPLNHIDIRLWEQLHQEAGLVGVRSGGVRCRESKINPLPMGDTVLAIILVTKSSRSWTTSPFKSH